MESFEAVARGAIEAGDIVTIEGRVRRRWWELWKPRYRTVASTWVAAPLSGELAQTATNQPGT